MIYRAAAALAHEDRTRALDGLRGRLRIMAVAAGATPDWTTLSVADTAAEVSTVSRLQVLTQAGTAMLADANSSTRSMLKLLAA